MAQVGDSAYTPHGVGEITDAVKERGRVSYRVAGRGFNVWVDETKLRVAGGDMGYAFTGGDEEDARKPKHHPSGEWARQHPDWGKDFDHDINTFQPMVPHYSGLEVTIDPGGGVVNKDNHTTLPYDPTPQYSVDMFRQDQNIQPGENKIDPAKRLHPSDSMSFDRRTDVRGPRPSSSLFATPGGGSRFDNERTSAHGDLIRNRSPFHEVHPEDEEGFHDPSLEGYDEFNPYSRHHGGRHDRPPTRMVPMGDEEYDAYMSEDPGYSGGRHETYDIPRGEDVGAGYHPGKPFRVPSVTERDNEAPYRSAGLDKRYAYFELEAADNDSPVAQFRRDPVAYTRLCGHLWTDGDDTLEKFADYTQLIDVDPRMREAAWSDVRQKAMRLRHEGSVQVNDHGQGRIYATVKGDNGTYDVMIVKGGSYGGLGGGQSITDWACSCPWGRWAFKRQMSYVGRLCSHGYATYLTMQAKDIGPEHFQKSAGVDDYKSWLKETGQSPEPSSVDAYLDTIGQDVDEEEANKLYDYASDNLDECPERDYDIDYTNDPEVAYKKADLLRNKPRSLTPSLHEVPEGDGEVWMDLLKDERDTTGPDQIVHFSSHDTMASLHRTADNPNDNQTVPAPYYRGTPGGWSPTKPKPTAPAPTPSKPTGPQPYYRQTPGGQAPPGGQRQQAPVGQPPAVDPTKTAPSGGHDPTSAPPKTTDTKPPPVPGSPAAGGPAGPAPAASPVVPHGTALSGPPTPTPGDASQSGGWKANPGLDSAGTRSINTENYRVNTGDTLNTILERAYGKDNVDSKKQEVMTLNRITNPDQIQADTNMALPGADKTNSVTGKPAETAGPGKPALSPDLPVGQAPAGTEPAAAPGRAPEQPNVVNRTPSTPPVQPAPVQQPTGPLPGPPPGTPHLTHRLRRYADSSDSSLLDKLRDMSSTPAADDLGHMDSRNDELRDVVDELQDRGYDASFMVAAHEDAVDDLALMGQMLPGGQVDQGFAGSGPSPSDWSTDSEGYVEDNERPHHVDDWHEDDGSDIIKFNDGRSKPQQGPGKSSSYNKTAFLLHYGGAGEDEEAEGTGAFNPDNPDAQDWEKGDPVNYLREMKDLVSSGGGGGGGMPGIPGLGGGGGAAAGGEAAAGSELAELAPLLLAAGRVGRGPVNRPRIDPGTRQPGQHLAAAPPPEDFGYDGHEVEASRDTPDGGDIVAAFHRSGAAAAVMSEPSTNDDIAASAQAFLRTAGRKYTPDEQRELEAEFHPQGARNLPDDDDLAGTHYLML